MKIVALTLQSSQLTEQKRFYTEVLDLRLLTSQPDGFTVQAGATRLTWQAAAPGTQPHYHMAFNIPENKIQEAQEWAASRVTLQMEEGEVIQHFESWNAHSLYFLDAAGNGLELIARHNLETATDAHFGPDQIISVSEISLGAPDSVALYHEVAPRVGARTFPPGRLPGGTFNPTGDDHGLLLLAQLGRPWFVSGGVATASPVAITLQGQEPGLYQADGLPFTIEVVQGY